MDEPNKLPTARNKAFTIASSSSSSYTRADTEMEIASASTANSLASFALDDGGNLSRRPPSLVPAFKRWNSMPGITFNYSMRCPDPSSSSEDEDEDEEEQQQNDSNSADTVPPLTSVERKSASFCTFDGRPKSASSGGYVIRHRSSSNALYLPYRLLDKGIEKLKREANVRNCIETDYAGEKMSITGAAIMYSMDEFTLGESGQPDSMGSLEQRRRTQSLTEPVHVLTNLLPASCSPSPTRIEKQCYSPSMQQVVRSIAMSPTPSPSPTRRQCIRSLSPIALRTGMGLKRKYTADTDSDTVPSVLPKRANYSVPTTPLASGSENPRPPPLFGLASQCLNHSLSESSIDSECSVSTIGSDYTNVSGTSHVMFTSHCQLMSTRATTSSPVTTTAPLVDMATEINPIAEESIIDE